MWWHPKWLNNNRRVFAGKGTTQRLNRAIVFNGRRKAEYLFQLTGYSNLPTCPEVKSLMVETLLLLYLPDAISI